MNTSFLMGWLAGTLLPLGAGWLLHRLVLRRERCFGYNRAVLLLAPVVAAVLPLLPRPNVAGWLAPAQAQLEVVQVVALPALSAPATQAAGWQLSTWLLGLYLLGVAVALAGLAYRYAQLRRATRHLPREYRSGYVLAYTGGRLPTSSFGRTIFWDDTADLTATEATSVLAHELVHVRQGHSFEVLWLEGWRALLWFNPFAHLLVPALRLTHELLADWEAMLLVASPADALAPAPPYPSLLARLAVHRVVGVHYSSLIQSFAFSFTLTRIAMLQNQLPVRRWKQWLALPVLGGLFVVACQNTNTDAVQPAADKEARKAAFMANIKEAIRQDSLRTGKGWQDDGKIMQMNIDKDGNVTITHQPDVPPPPVPMPQGAREEAAAGKIYTYAEQMPQLPGTSGMSAIVQQIQDNLVYPAGAPQEGRVFASFTVQADGSVGDTRIVKGLAPAYDEAVLTAIRQLPRFVPGKQGGNAVAVSFTVPLLFKKKP